MPSRDRILPEQNRWIGEWAKPDVIGSPARTRADTPIGRRVPLAAVLLRRAAARGKSPDEYVERIPEDTLKRLRHPVIEEPQKDGTVIFKHDKGIIEGRKSALR